MPVIGKQESAVARSPDVVWHEAALSREERWADLGQRGATLWFTGLSGSGKSTVATAVESALVQAGRSAYRLDGDNLRHGLNADLGFSTEDRDENVRRVGEVAALFADAGTVALVALVSPFREARELVRAAHARAGLPFCEIWVNTSLEECQRRDPKGLYQRSARGEVTGMTGLASPYEAPRQPELQLPLDRLALPEAVSLVLSLLEG